MESSLSEEIQVSPEEAELPDMIPVSIRTSLPEFQHYSPLERVLAGVLLTWKEFLQLFDIRVEPTDYIIRGSNGTAVDLNDKIGDYVNTFKRKLKIYPVTLERVTSVAENPRSHRTSTHSEGSNQSRNDGASGDHRSGGPASKKLKLMDEDKRKSRRMTKESLEKIAQTVMQGQSTTSKRSTSKKVDNKRGSNKSRSPTPSSIIDIKPTVDAASTSKSTSNLQLVAINQVSTETFGASSKLKRLSSDHSQVKEIVPSSSAAPVGKRGRKPRNSRTLSSRRSTKESANTAVESNEEATSDSDDEEDPTKEKKKLLKQNVVKYLSEKVSARSFLRLRNELMALREQEKYFKVTTVVPITAGMMEQAFCRKLVD